MSSPKSTLFTNIKPPTDQKSATEISTDISGRNELSITLTIYLEKGGHLMAVLLSYVMRVAAPNIFHHPQEPVPRLRNLLEQIFKVQEHPLTEPLTHTPVTFQAKPKNPNDTPPTLTIFIRSTDTRVELKILTDGLFNPDLMIEYMRFLVGQVDSFQQIKADLSVPDQPSQNELDLAHNMASFFIRGIQITGQSPAANTIINQSSLAGLTGGWNPRFMPVDKEGRIIRPGQAGNTTGMQGPRT